MAEKIFVVEILNWEKFQGRSDVKNASWLKLNHNTFFSPALVTLGPEGKLLWFYLLCEASRSIRRGFATITARSVNHSTGISENEFNHSILHLQQFQMVTVQTLRARNVRGTFACTREEKKREEEKREEEIIHAQPNGRASVFDFEQIYREYPRRVGKARGIKTCKAQIRTLEDFEALQKAVEHYTDYVTKSATEVRFIKHFSTFMSEWRDWIDPETGSSKTPKSEEFLAWEEEQRRISGG